MEHRAAQARINPLQLPHRINAQLLLHIVTHGYTMQECPRDFILFKKDVIPLSTDLRTLRWNTALTEGEREKLLKTADEIGELVRMLTKVYWPYAAQTSKKIRAVNRMKAENGKRISPAIPFGYRKNPDNEDHWLIDEPAAEVVRKIYTYCLQGRGPEQIARALEQEKIMTPTEYGNSRMPMILVLIGNVAVRQIFLAVSMASNQAVENIYYSYPIAWFGSSLLVLVYFLLVKNRMSNRE